MRKIIIITAIIFASITAQGQNYFEWVMPTEKGDVSYLLLTDQGYETLLKPLQIQDSGDLAEELLTMRAEITNNRELIDKLYSIIKDLQNQESSLSETSQKILDCLRDDTENQIKARGFTIAQYKQFAFELEFDIKERKEDAIINELKDWYKSNNQ